MEVTVDYGTASGFLEWDDATDQFVIHEGVANEQYIGDHVICMKVEYLNDTYSERYEDCFTLTIEAPSIKPVSNETSWTPPDQNKYIPEPIEPFIVSDLGLEQGPFNPRQPVPFIADLSIDGVLVIGWDRSMTKRNDYEKIDPSRVAINNSSDIALAEKADDDLKSLQDYASQGDRRQLIYRHEGVYKNQTTLDEQWLLVVEALEVRMDPGEFSDENQLNLTW